jgi:hypothetical protein
VLAFGNEVREIYVLHNVINENLSSRNFYTFHPIWEKRYRICLQNVPRFSEFRENSLSGSHNSLRCIKIYIISSKFFSDLD